MVTFHSVVVIAAAATIHYRNSIRINGAGLASILIVVIIVAAAVVAAISLRNTVEKSVFKVPVVNTINNGDEYEDDDVAYHSSIPPPCGYEGNNTKNNRCHRYPESSFPC